MSRLRNQNRERFAVAVADTWPLELAYERAGYSGAPGAAEKAAKLAAVPEVVARIKEIRADYAELLARRPNHWRPMFGTLPARPGWYAIEFVTEGPGPLPDTAYWDGAAFVAIVAGAVRRSAEPFNDEPAAFDWAADHCARAI